MAAVSRGHPCIDAMFISPRSAARTLINVDEAVSVMSHATARAVWNPRQGSLHSVVKHLCNLT
jgi:hypothetical protein